MKSESAPNWNLRDGVNARPWCPVLTSVRVFGHLRLAYHLPHPSASVTISALLLAGESTDIHNQSLDLVNISLQRGYNACQVDCNSGGFLPSVIQDRNPQPDVHMTL